MQRPLALSGKNRSQDKHKPAGNQWCFIILGLSITPLVSRGCAWLRLVVVCGRFSLANAFCDVPEGLPWLVRWWSLAETQDVVLFDFFFFSLQEIRKLETWQEPLKGNRFS